MAGDVQDARYVVKAGPRRRGGQLRRAPAGTRLHVQPEFDRRIESRLRRYFDRYSTVSFDHYPVRLPGAPCAIAADVEIRGVFIQDTFAEAFGMRAARLVITARTHKWARGGAEAHRVRHVGHRLQVRSGH